MLNSFVTRENKSVVHDFVQVRPEMFFIVLAYFLAKVLAHCSENFTTADEALKAILLIHHRDMSVAVAVQDRRDGKHIGFRRNGNRVTFHNGCDGHWLTRKASEHLI